MYNKIIYLEDVNMNYYKKIKKPKRDDPEYKEIEKFEDYELINNFIYECIIRTEAVKRLGLKYDYCSKKYNDIKNFMDLDQYIKEQIEEFFNNNAIDNHECTQNEETETFEIENDFYRTEQELFEEALEFVKKEQYKLFNNEEFELINEDLETFKNKNNVPLKKENKHELYELSSYLNSTLSKIKEVVKNTFYLEPSKKFKEYENYSFSSLYIKRECKETYYIETIVDRDNRKISKRIQYLTKRKLYIKDIFEFSSNHLLLPIQSKKFLETFFKIDKKYLRSNKIISHCFFCYDYYMFRINEVETINKKNNDINDTNNFIIEYKENISNIRECTHLTDKEKNDEIESFKLKIKDELIPRQNIPTLNKKSINYIFDEKEFKKSGINRNTALSYYQWISSFIKDYNYMDIINFNKID